MGTVLTREANNLAENSSEKSVRHTFTIGLRFFSRTNGIILNMSILDHSPSRRNFLRQSFVFSAASAFHPLASFAANSKSSPNPHAAHALMIGDWGDDRRLDSQSSVARAM